MRVSPRGRVLYRSSAMDLYSASEDVPAGTHPSISRLRPRTDVGSDATASATSTFDSLREQLRLALSDDDATLGQGQRDERVKAFDTTGSLVPVTASTSGFVSPAKATAYGSGPVTPLRRALLTDERDTITVGHGQRVDLSNVYHDTYGIPRSGSHGSSPTDRYHITKARAARQPPLVRASPATASALTVASTKLDKSWS